MIIKLNGEFVDLELVDFDVCWILEEDCFVMYSVVFLVGVKVFEGEWWLEIYKGGFLVFFDIDIVCGLCL